MGAHLIDGEFQSDKYPTTPRGKVPLSVKDPTAQDLLWEYAQRRRAMDAEFSDDLEAALRAAGYAPVIASEFLFRRIDDLPLSPRSKNALSNYKVTFIGELVQKHPTELLRCLRNFGSASLREVDDFLKLMGLTLGMKLDHWPEMLERWKQQQEKP